MGGWDAVWGHTAFNRRDAAWGHAAFNRNEVARWGTRRCFVFVLRFWFFDQNSGFQQWWCSANQAGTCGFIVKNFTTVGPLFGLFHQSVPNRVQADVFPFAGFAFGGAKFMVVIT